MLKLTGYWDKKYPTKFVGTSGGVDVRKYLGSITGDTITWKRKTPYTSVHENKIKLPKRTTPKWFDDLPE